MYHHYRVGEFATDRINQFHAEAREWRLAKSARAGERARVSHTFRPTRSLTGAVRYGLGTLCAIAIILIALVG